jgi:phosphatidate cytidylyltransferase
MTEAAPQARKNADLPTRFVAGIVLIAIAVLATYASGWPFRVLAALAAALMLLEWGDMHRVWRGWTWLAVAAVAGVVLAYVEFLYPASVNSPTLIDPDDLQDAWPGFAAIGAAALVVGIASRRVSMGWGVLYVAIPAFALVVLDWAWPELVLWAFLLTWATDIFAYFAGRAIGGPKLAPRLSPNKTWAGLAGGVIGAAVTGWVAGWAMDIDPVFLFLGAPMGVLAQLGDLYESSVKRRLGVKDSGRIIPGHGGVLDRLDGLLPVVLATYGVLLLLSLGKL